MSKFIRIPILNNEYEVIAYFGKPKGLKKVLERFNYPEVDVHTSVNDKRGVCFSTEGCHPIIAMPNKPTTPDEIGTLAHEATHAVEAIAKSIGEIMTGEILAHSIGAIVREVLKKC